MQTEAEALPVMTIQRKSLAAAVADNIRRAVISGEYQLGQKLREAKLCKMYGVSTSVVREAFHILAGEGVVVSDLFRGRSVFNLTQEEAYEVVLMRASLESLAASLAAEKLDDLASDEIQSRANHFKTAIPASFPDWVDLELEFHRAIWKAAKNEWLYKHLNQLVVPTISFNTVHLFHNMGPQDILRASLERERNNMVEGHQVLAGYILARDSQKAREAVIRHLLSAAKFGKARTDLLNLASPAA